MKLGFLALFEPAKYIGGEADPLLVRWIVFRVPWFGVYLHKFCRSDHDRALHDHPWTFISIILRGGYFEVVDDNKPEHWRGPGSILYRPAEFRHRVVLTRGKVSWNLILVGRRRRRWGFWTKTGWCWWRKYNYQTALCEEEILYTDFKD